MRVLQPGLSTAKKKKRSVDASFRLSHVLQPCHAYPPPHALWTARCVRLMLLVFLLLFGMLCILFLFHISLPSPAVAVVVVVVLSRLCEFRAGFIDAS